MKMKPVSQIFLLSANMPEAVWLALAHEATGRDLTTARRTLLLTQLWQENYQRQAGLVACVRYRLGLGCFGANSELTFRRDMQAVKAILAAAGYGLKYSRRPAKPGYYIPGRPDLAPETLQAIRGAVQEVDLRQIEIWRQMTPAQRVRLAMRLSADMLSMAVQRLMQERPALDRRAARREVLHRYYQLNGS